MKFPKLKSPEDLSYAALWLAVQIDSHVSAHDDAEGEQFLSYLVDSLVKFGMELA